jgi:hypothetical protein
MGVMRFIWWWFDGLRPFEHCLNGLRPFEGGLNGLRPFESCLKVV